MSDVRGLVTYFNFDNFGFYRIRKGKAGEHHGGTIEDIFSDLDRWLAGKNLKDTLVFDPQLISRQSRMYCRSFAKDSATGDVVMTLWRAVGTKNGGVGGAFADESLSSESKETLKTGTEIDGKEIIWGQPSYYWVIPEYNKVASIRLPNAIIDTAALCQYIKSYVDYRRDSVHKKFVPREFVHPKTLNKVKTNTVTYEYTDEKESYSLNFKVLARQYKKNTSDADLEKISQEVTHIVYRESIRKSVPDTRKEWVKLFDKFGDLIGLDTEKPTTEEVNNIELIVEASPTTESLEAMFEHYAEEYSEEDVWCNIGLKRDGRTGRTTWLNEFVVTDEINLPETTSDYYEASEIMSVLKTHRARLVKSLTFDKNPEDNNPKDKDPEEKESSSKEELVVELNTANG